MPDTCQPVTDEPETETQRAVRLYRSGNVQWALMIAKRFRIGLDISERAQLRRGYECFVWPEFYRAIGFDPGTEIEKAKRMFEQRIMRVEVQSNG